MTKQKKQEDKNKPEKTNKIDPFYSEEDLKLFFDKINESHFSSSVPVSRVKWSDRIGSKDGELADFTLFGADNNFIPVIRLSKTKLSREKVLKVCESLFREMIHIWLWQNKQPWGYTEDFYRKAKEFDFRTLNLEQNSGQ